MQVKSNIIRIQPKTFFLILLTLLTLAIATPVLADYLGPDRTVTATTGVCKIVLYEYGFVPSKGDYRYHRVDDWSCSNEGKPWLAYPSDPSSSPYEGHQYWQKEEVLQEVTTTYPPATINSSLQNCTLNNGWCTTAPALALNGTESITGQSILAIEGSLNGQSFACSGSSCDVPLNEGDNNLTFWALSSWGDSSEMGTFTANVDTVSPNVGLDISGSNGTNGWYVSPTTVTATGSDSTSGLQSVLLSVDNGTWQSSMTLTDGVYTITVQAQDNAGNISTSSTTISIDTTTPSIDISTTGTAGSNGWYRSSVAVTASASDATSGIETLEVSSDGGAYLPYSSPIAFSDGHHTIQFKATDKAGNVTETPVQEFFVDTDAPTIDIPTSWESGKTIDYNIQDFGSGLSTLRIVIEDEDERYAKVAWNELVSGSQFNGEITWDGKFADGTLAPPGEYLVWIKATDQAGNERFGLGRVIVPEPNVVFSLFKSETTSESNPTPPRELTDPTDALTTSPLTTSSSSNSSASTGLSASFGGSTNPTKETDNQSLILASGITSSTTTTTNSNIVWGAGVAAMIGAAMAYALDEQRKRKEEEAQQRAQVQAEVDATNAALEASRQARREAAKIQGWLQGQAMLEAYIKAAEEQGATDAQIAELRQQGATQGFGAAIDSASDLNRDLFHLNTQNARMEAKMERIEAEEEAAWRAAQLELQRRAEEERKAAQEQQALADWRAGEKAEYVPPEPPSFWENPFGWFQATPLYTDVIEPYVVQPVQEAVTAITTVVEEKVVQPIQNIVAPVKNKPGKAPGLALIAPPAIEPPPWLKRLLDSGKKAVEDIAEWTIDTWEDGKQWVNTNVVQPAKEAVNKTVATVQNFVTTAVATAKNKYEEVKKDIQEKWEDIKQWVDTNVVQPHIHQAFRIGWNWLTEQGGGSSKDDRMLFGPDDQMTQDFMNSEGAQEAWQEFLDNGGVQPNGFYAVEVNFEAYYKGFIFKASWTETFVGGHIIYITNNGDGTATFTINNTTGLASLTHNPQSNYLNPSVETILGNLNNDPFGYMPKRLPTSFGDFMYNYSPSSIFTDRERSDPGLGGNMYQRYTWTVPIP